ncbi:HhH-GPD-type base excision DNA repair protein [Blastococcus sp. TML/C7B]|uniref:HhH-GPD-type base excision DNA repair protein n=1 Tax=Blastococcus sp. TML/C7B TaxID=2798728 RepID=UPI0028154E9E|nr:HhH-GPD-type base excision DNA repair protein [Blastococcus sp. TML/C7B]
MPNLRIAQDDAADELLGRDPLALLIGMLLDQQFPMERAFSAPRLLADRLGVDTLDAAQLAGMDPEALTAVFQGPPALHRYPGSMAGRAQELCRLLVERYDGRAENLWAGATDGKALLRRLKELPGFRRAEGVDLPGAARQAVRRRPGRLAGGRRRLRRGGLAPLGRRHHRAGVAGRGAPVQAGAEGGRQEGGRRRVMAEGCRTSCAQSPLQAEQPARR